MKLTKSIIQFFLYLIVGALATVVEWCVFYILNSYFLVHYAPSTIVAFVFSTAANWLFGRLLLFRSSKQNTAKELIKIYCVSIIGLLMNIVIMFINIEKIGFSEMLSKIIATTIVFIWNFLVRKLIIYKI